MNLDIRLRKKMPHFELSVAFGCPTEKITVIIGPSGAGKTTVMRLIAGLDKPDEGTIRFGEETWVDTQKNIFLPPQRRRLGYVFQDYVLFPHLTIYENAAFAAQDKHQVRHLLERFGLWHLRKRKPCDVSGGERQRCAICQSIARKPRAMLLDEPFSALDVFTRRDLRDELRDMEKELSMPVLYVTHDINEALYLADGIIPLVAGKVDREWMPRSISRVDTGGSVQAKATREPRLSLAY